MSARIGTKIIRNPYQGTGSSVVMRTMQDHAEAVEWMAESLGESVLGQVSGQIESDINEFWTVIVYDAEKLPA